MKDFFRVLMGKVPRGDTTRFLHEQKMPQARWTGLEDIYDSAALRFDPDNPGERVLLGALDDRLIGIADNRHGITFAGSRAGKSVTLTSNLLFYRGSVLATDPKGELARLTAARREALGQKVYVLDPFNYAPERIGHLRARYNPLSVLRTDSPTLIEDANLIADAIVVPAPQSKDPHWDESARDFIEGLILHVITSPDHEGARNLVTVRELIQRVREDESSADDEDEYLFVLERAMLENALRLQGDPKTADIGLAIEGSARSFYEKADRERDSALSTIRRHTKFLDYPALRNALSGHDFDLADLKRDPAGVTVYLCFPATRIDMAGRWLRIFINQLLDAMEREKAATAAPVLACLDEFPVLGYMRQLENAVGQIASFGVKLWVIVQDFSQIKALYGERAESFIANAGFIQCFGITDIATAEYVSRMLGKTPVEITREGEVSPEQAAQGLTGKSSVIELHDLLTADEITRQFARSDPDRKQLVIWAGVDPLIVQRVEWFDKSSPVYEHFAGLVPDESAATRDGAQA